MELRPYQIQALKAIADAEKQGITRQLIVMGTGLGKTILVAAAIKERGTPNTFGLMHREELLAQGSDKILALNPGAKVAWEKAGDRADPDSHSVVLASVQSVGRKDRVRISRFPREWPQIVWVDEVHHVVASSYLEVMDHFGLYGDSPRRNALLLGTTATPDRLDEMGYDKIFDDVTFRYGLRDAIKDGWLADIRAWNIKTDVDLSEVKSRAGDFKEEDLAKAVLQSNMNDSAARTWDERCRGRRSIFFCVTKAHARQFNEMLLKRGAKSAVITDDTPREERTGAISLFKSGDIEALVNVMVLGEGFDAPDTEFIHILRPTQSQGLYTQQIGRGTRRTPTKSFVEVFDYAGQQHDICSIGQIFGLPDSWQLRGQSASEDADKVEEVENELGLPADGAKSLEDMTRRIHERRVDMVKGVLEDSGLPSKFAWIRPIRSQERWFLSWRNETRAKVSKIPPARRAQATEIIEKGNLWGVHERFEILRNELGMYEARLRQTKPSGAFDERKFHSGRSLAKVVSHVEKAIQASRPYKMALINKKAKWGSEPSTQKQRDWLRIKGVPVEVLPQLTKREASSLIEIPEATIRRWFAKTDGGAK